MPQPDNNSKEFSFAFHDEGGNKFTYKVSPEGHERLSLSEFEGMKMLYGNQEGLLVLARICIKLALGTYPGGMHIHLTEDFGFDSPEMMLIGIEPKEDR